MPLPDSVTTQTGVVLDKGDAASWEAAHPGWSVERTEREDGSVRLVVWTPEGQPSYHSHAAECPACRFYPYPSIQRERELLAQRTPA